MPAADRIVDDDALNFDGDDVAASMPLRFVYGDAP